VGQRLIFNLAEKDSVVMYFELKSENWNDVQDAIAKAKESAGPVQITLRRSDGLYCLVALCKSEPDPSA
jgi:hypothetical protein